MAPTPLASIALEHNEFHIATLAGELWGDMIYRKEQEADAKLTPTQRLAKEAKLIVAEATRKKEVIAERVALHHQRYTNASHGLSVKKFNTPCKHEHEEGGCWAHKANAGACSFIHTGEEAYSAVFASFGVPYSAVPSRNALWVVGVKNGLAILSKTHPNPVKPVKPTKKH